jgi:hypothetical protein
VIRQFFGDLQRDAKILMISRGIRAFPFTWTILCALSFTMAMVESNERGSAAARLVTPFGSARPFDLSHANGVLDASLVHRRRVTIAQMTAFFLMFRHVRPPEELAMNERSIIG